jgi:hypothetical protein
MTDPKPDPRMNAALAWEHFKAVEVPTLWRVIWMRPMRPSSGKGKMYRCVDYFNDEKQAWEYAAAMTERGFDVLRVDKFTMEVSDAK